MDADDLALLDALATLRAVQSGDWRGADEMVSAMSEEEFRELLVSTFALAARLIPPEMLDEVTRSIQTAEFA
jgi:hypothetical protein